MKATIVRHSVSTPRGAVSLAARLVQTIFPFFLASLASAGYAQNHYQNLGSLGGYGGDGFKELCSTNQNLIGFELHTGDDVDAIRPVCSTFSSPTHADEPPTPTPRGYSGWHGGSGGGESQMLLCPAATPVVLGIRVYSEGQKTRIVNTISLFCVRAVAGPQTVSLEPSAVFDAPHLHPGGGSFATVDTQSEQCPSGQVAVGMLGTSGIWVDSMGLICDRVRITEASSREPAKTIGRVNTGSPGAPRAQMSICDRAAAARQTNSPAAPYLEAQCRESEPVKSIGRISTGGQTPPRPPSSICQHAADARARNSPAAPVLEAQCRAHPDPATPPSQTPADQSAPTPGSLSTLAQRGRALASYNPLLKALHDSEPMGPNRLGFEVGLAIDEDGTLQGPGKERFKQALGANVSKDAFQRAVDFTIDRNANEEMVLKGDAVVAADPAVEAARARLPLSNQWLGFTIAAGLFGSAADGGSGNTQQGPGSNRIRDKLGASARLGYVAGLAFFNVP